MKDVDVFVKMFEANDVHEKDLQNEDNLLYRRILERTQNKTIIA